MKHDFAEPLRLIYTDASDDLDPYKVVDAKGRVIFKKQCQMYESDTCQTDDQALDIVNRVNACANLNVANGELERLLEAVNETLKHESGNGYQPLIVNLRTALNAIRAPAPAAKQIDADDPADFVPFDAADLTPIKDVNA